MSDVAPGHMLGRMGGDEFLVYTELGAEAEDLTERIRSRAEGDTQLENSRVAVPRLTDPYSRDHGCCGPVLTVSIGIGIGIGIGHAKPGTSCEQSIQAAI